MIPSELKLKTQSLEKNALEREETLFHCANGYLGVRGCFEEGYPEDSFSVRGAYINGFYDIADIPYGEKLYGFPSTRQTMINLPDAQTVRLFCGGERFDPFTGELLNYSRTLDMAEGFTERDMLWRSPLGHTLRVRVRRMVSFAMKELFLIDYTVESVDYSGELRFDSHINGDVTNYSNADDPRVASGVERHLVVERACAEEGVLRLACRTARSNLTVACAAAHVLSREGSFQYAADEKRASGSIITHIAPGESVRLLKFCAYADSRRHESPMEQAVELIKEAAAEGAEHWYACQAQYLRRFWDNARVTIEGNERMQAYIDFNLYQLLQGAGKDGISNVPAKGLSGEGYEGHYFWDTEIYVLLFFLLTDPPLAKNLLDFRYNLLDAAREHARVMGHASGALYPWRTITGAECSSYFPSGSAQYHINADVAHSFVQYFLATGDVDYMAQKGAEVLIETARLFIDAGHELDGSFRIDNVTGPDEYTCIVNNNYYTNAGAKETLLWAARICEILRAAGRFEGVLSRTGITEAEEAYFKKAAQSMYLPYDEKLGILKQDDSFLSKKRLELAAIPKENFPLLLHYHPLFIYRHQVCKQPDAVLSLWLFGDGVDMEAGKRTYDYYEAVTTHDSSLSKCIFSIMAARLGNMEKAYRYFEETVVADLNDAHANTRDGIHMAGMGGAYLSIAAGFCGLTLLPEGLCLNPRLPAQWSGLRFGVRYMGSRIHIEVNQIGCTVRVAEGTPQRIRLCGEWYTVGGEPVTAAIG